MPQAHALLVAPTGPGVGLTSVSLGLVRALERRGLKVGFVKPIRQPGADDGLERSTEFIERTTTIRPGESLAFRDAEALLSAGKRSELLQAVVGRYRHAADGADVVIVEGLAATAEHPGLDTLNGQMAKAIDAEVVLVTTLGESLPAFVDRLTLAAETFGGSRDPKVLGAVVNRLNAPRMDVIGTTRTALKRPDVTYDAASIRAAAGVFTAQFDLLGAVPFDPIMVSPRTFDVAQHLGATVLSQGDLMTRRVVDVSLVARTVANMTHRLRAGALLITPADRDDVILAVSMAAMNGTPLAGLVLTGDLEPSPHVMRLCAKAFATGLPLMSVATDSYVTAARSAAMNLEVPVDDVARIEKVMERVAEHLEIDGLVERVLAERVPRLSPPAFLHSLVEGARAAGRRIVLPEGTEPRTLEAAASCAQRGIATCVLIGDEDAVNAAAEAQGITLGPGIEVVTPSDEVRERYVPAMVELRKHKGLTADGARNQLRDDVVLATMMLAQGEVDGLVAGAINTTAHTIRPALQLIKTRPDTKLVSSVFFMCLPDEVVVAHKTGSLRGVVNDVGVIHAEAGPLTVCFLTDGQPDPAATSADIGRCALRAYAAWMEASC